MSVRGTRGWARSTGWGLSPACGLLPTQGGAFRFRIVAPGERFLWTGRRGASSPRRRDARKETQTFQVAASPRACPVQNCRGPTAS